ncbi:tyrosine-type recombinase/integrase [Sporosarcina newyorkensis]|uniref:tyrosine-type recombinase/integrase n=1 Tax=Sporosarcina newyorkensis TaxID=759851 RepID=UPI003CFF1495
MANIEQRGENSYRFTVYLPKDAKGRYPKERMTYTVEGKYTPKQLQEHLNHEYLKFKAEVLSGNYVRPEAMTFSAFIKEWDKKYASKLAKTTHGNHVRKLDLHILPEVGHMEMTQINEFILMKLLDGLQRKDEQDGELSFHYKQDIYRTLKSIFKYAVKWKVLNHNPMDGVEKPKAKDTEDEHQDLQVYDEGEIAQLMKIIQNELPHWRAMFTLALAAGMRRGELLGLQWDDIDFDNNQITIHTSIVLTKDGPHIKKTKTRSSKRTVTLPISMMEGLRIFQQHHEKTWKDSGDRWIETEYNWVFCKYNGTHMYPSSPSNRWAKMLQKHDFRYIRLHDLRHTSASLLIAQGVHAKIISERLGHSDISVTMNTYGHAFKSADRAAAEKMESIFSKR